jgi:hypothetical protein
MNDAMRAAGRQMRGALGVLTIGLIGLDAPLEIVVKAARWRRVAHLASIGAAFTAALLLPAAHAFGQTTHPTDEVRENARSRLGPFYITPALELRDLGVDDNVFNEAADPKSDFTFTLVPRADVAVPVAHTLLLRSTVAADITYYQKYSGERSVSPRLAPRATIFLNKLSFFGEGSYLRSRQRPNYEIDARALRTERAVGGGIGYQLSPNVAIELAGRRSEVKYDAEEIFQDVSLQETLNRKTGTLAAAVRYGVTPLTTIVLKADRSQDRFDFSSERDADTLRVTPGVEFNPTALIAGSAYVGFRRFDAKSDALADFQGLVASAALGYTLLGRTTFIVNAQRDLTYSFERFRPYFVENSYGLTVRQRISGKFDLTAGAGRHQYTYRNLLAADPVAPPLVSPDHREDVTRNYSVSIGYSLGENVRLGFGTAYWTRGSNLAAYRNYDALRTGISLNYGF